MVTQHVIPPWDAKALAVALVSVWSSPPPSLPAALAAAPWGLVNACGGEARCPKGKRMCAEKKDSACGGVVTSIGGAN